MNFVVDFSLLLLSKEKNSRELGKAGKEGCWELRV
jgi:hypothetical protein